MNAAYTHTGVPSAAQGLAVRGLRQALLRPGRGDATFPAGVPSFPYSEALRGAPYEEGAADVLRPRTHIVELRVREDAQSRFPAMSASSLEANRAAIPPHAAVGANPILDTTLSQTSEVTTSFQHSSDAPLEAADGRLWAP